MPAARQYIHNTHEGTNWEGVFSGGPANSYMMQQQKNCWKESFLSSLCQRCYKQEKLKSLVSCETVIGQYRCEKRSWGSKTLEAITTSEDTAGWEDLVHAVVNCWACELAIAL
jgi:hypothetical protein